MEIHGYTATKIMIPEALLCEVLGVLDSGESVKITFVADKKYEPNGAYIVEFEKPQMFNSAWDTDYDQIIPFNATHRF